MVHVNESDPKFLDLRSVLAEVQRLREENIRLRCLLQEHGIHIPAVQSTTGIPVTTSALPRAHIPVLKAEQRIALFRSLFDGRDDVYAVRWENTDGRYGDMPKADRDWKAYLRAKDEDRKRVDRQTRKFRARMYARRLRGYGLIGYTIPDASNETSFLQQLEHQAPKEPSINGEI